RLRLQLSERVRVDDPVPVDLERVPIVGLPAGAEIFAVEGVVEPVGHQERFRHEPLRTHDAISQCPTPPSRPHWARARLPGTTTASRASFFPTPTGSGPAVTPR